MPLPHPGPSQLSARMPRCWAFLVAQLSAKEEGPGNPNSEGPGVPEDRRSLPSGLPRSVRTSRGTQAGLWGPEQPLALWLGRRQAGACQGSGGAEQLTQHPEELGRRARGAPLPPGSTSLPGADRPARWAGC